MSSETINTFLAQISSQTQAILDKKETSFETASELVNVAGALETQIKSSQDIQKKEYLKKEFGWQLRKHDRVPCIIAEAFDELLRKNTTDEINDFSTKLVHLLGYVYDKDIFIYYYHRLLFKRSSNLNVKHELNVLEKLKKNYGISFVMKSESLINDVNTSKKMNDEFQNELEKNDFSLNVNSEMNIYTDLSVDKILSGNNIPIDYLPEDLKDSFLLFEDFYNSKHKNRTLKLSQNQSICEMTANFKSGQYQLKLNAIQASLMNMFNNESKLKKSEIEKIFGDDTLKLFLTRKIFCEVNNDIISINEDFTSNESNIDLTKPLNEEKEKQKNETLINKPMELTIDAAIFRIMRCRNKLHLDELFKESSSQLANSFSLDRKLFKARVDGLLDKEYLERDEKDPHLFHFLP
eukprot:gene2579-3541_t